MNDRSDRWAAIGEQVTAAMDEQAMSQADLVRRAGVSDFTVRRLMRGTAGNYRRAVLGKVSLALWDDALKLPTLVEAAVDPEDHGLAAQLGDARGKFAADDESDRAGGPVVQSFDPPSEDIP